MANNNSNTSERYNLIGRYVGGEATDEDLMELTLLLESKPEAIQEFVSAAELERDLHEVYKVSSKAKSFAKGRVPRNKPATVIKFPRLQQTKWIASIAAIAAMILLAFAIFKTTPEPVVIARVAETSQGAALIRDGNELPLKPNAELHAGDKIKVAGQNTVTIDYADHTRLTLGSAAEYESVAIFDEESVQASAAGSPNSKKIYLESGVIAADVAPQPAGKPMLIRTARATAEVIGTQLKLSVEKESTRLDVIEGKVRMQRLEDRAVAMVGSGEFAVAARDTEFTPRAILKRAKILITCDDEYELYLNGTLLGKRAWPAGTTLYEPQTFDVALLPGSNVVAVKGVNVDNVAGLLVEIQMEAQRIISNKEWKTCRTAGPNWVSIDYDDSQWLNAVEYGTNSTPDYSKHALATHFHDVSEAEWIWSANNLYSKTNESDNTMYFRFKFLSNRPVHHTLYSQRNTLIGR